MKNERTGFWYLVGCCMKGGVIGIVAGILLSAILAVVIGLLIFLAGSLFLALT